ncbi:MAG TPA: hypothetical protein PLH15_06790 [Spirochaetota bacterium]|jgi:hypothetical protein|nr:hypothetical protein [Spirochaetota bacterium]HQO22977.1 hypothetical protein [Spirochaetota bacterium]HQQ23531.1 hypothetical protein [Spirochaetota bacterium]
MFKRKQYIIDKGIQLRTTFTAIGFTFLCVTLFIVLMGVYINETNKRIRNIIITEDQIFQVLTTVTDTGSEEQTAMNVEMARQHQTNMETVTKMVNSNIWIIWGIIAAVFLSGIIFFFILILQTHRIAGPIYVMTYYMKEFLDGRKHEHLRPLRKHDQLKDFYQLFKEFMAKVNSGKTAKLTAPAVKKAVKKTTAKKTAAKKK